MDFRVVHEEDRRLTTESSKLVRALNGRTKEREEEREKRREGRIRRFEKIQGRRHGNDKETDGSFIAKCLGAPYLVVYVHPAILL